MNFNRPLSNYLFCFFEFVLLERLSNELQLNAKSNILIAIKIETTIINFILS